MALLLVFSVCESRFIIGILLLVKLSRKCEHGLMSAIIMLNKYLTKWCSLTIDPKSEPCTHLQDHSKWHKWRWRSCTIPPQRCTHEEKEKKKKKKPMKWNAWDLRSTRFLTTLAWIIKISFRLTIQWRAHINYHANGSSINTLIA